MASRTARGAVVVTGASGGIGRAIAMRFARAGRPLLLTGRAETVLAEIAADVERAGGTATTLVADLLDPEGPARIIAAALARGGGLLGVVSCAGGSAFRRFEQMDAAAFDADLRLNFLAPTALARAALPHLAPDGEARAFLIFVNSIIAREPAPPRGTGYVSAKAALLHFADGLFAEIRDRGIVVTSILPDLTDTPLVPVRGHPDRSSLIDPASVAEAVWFAATAAPDVCITELHLRPQLAAKRSAS